MVSYGENCFKDKEAHKLHKALRKFSTKNTDKFFHFKYWIVEDLELAKKLGIEKPGDVYCIRETETPFNTKPANLDICDFPYTSERLLTVQEITDSIEGAFAKIVKLGFDAPIIVHNYMQFNLLR